MLGVRFCSPFLCCPCSSTYSTVYVPGSTRGPSELQMLNSPRLGCDDLSLECHLRSPAGLGWEASNGSGRVVAPTPHDFDLIHVDWGSLRPKISFNCKYSRQSSPLLPRQRGPASWTCAVSVIPDHKICSGRLSSWRSCCSSSSPLSLSGFRWWQWGSLCWVPRERHRWKPRRRRNRCGGRLSKAPVA